LEKERTALERKKFTKRKASPKEKIVALPKQSGLK
jgi:hypothetical protein